MSGTIPIRFINGLPREQELYPILNSLSIDELKYLLFSYNTILFDNNASHEMVNEAKKCIPLCKNEKDSRKQIVTLLPNLLLYIHYTYK